MIEGTVTFKPLKAGTIAVELEVADTEENLLVLSRMHKKKGHLLSEQEFTALPQDRFFLLLDIQTKCQQVQDLITAELHPIPTPVTTFVTSVPVTTTAPEPLTRMTKMVEGELTSEVLGDPRK